MESTGARSNYEFILFYDSFITMKWNYAVLWPMIAPLWEKSPGQIKHPLSLFIFIHFILYYHRLFVRCKKCLYFCNKYKICIRTYWIQNCTIYIPHRMVNCIFVDRFKNILMKITESGLDEKEKTLLLPFSDETFQIWGSVRQSFQSDYNTILLRLIDRKRKEV